MEILDEMEKFLKKIQLIKMYTRLKTKSRVAIWSSNSTPGNIAEETENTVS